MYFGPRRSVGIYQNWTVSAGLIGQLVHCYQRAGRGADFWGPQRPPQNLWFAIHIIIFAKIRPVNVSEICNKFINRESRMARTSIDSFVHHSANTMFVFRAIGNCLCAVCLCVCVLCVCFTKSAHERDNSIFFRVWNELCMRLFIVLSVCFIKKQIMWRMS